MTWKYPLLLACWALAGCQTVVTINPVVPDSAAVTDARLEGNWLAIDGSDSSHVVVTLEGRANYVIRDETKNNAWRAHLGHQGRWWVLDVSPTELAVKDLLIPSHFLAVVEFADQRLRFLYPQGDSLKRHLDDGRLRLPYLTLASGDIVITASTAQLSGALSGYLERPGVLDSVVVLRRLPDR